LFAFVVFGLVSSVNQSVTLALAFASKSVYWSWNLEHARLPDLWFISVEQNVVFQHSLILDDILQ